MPATIQVADHGHTMTIRSRRIFVSYSHEDEDLTPTVFTHLANLDQFFSVDLWIDQTRIRAGDRWQPEIEKALATADLAVLLISPKFLASRFIKEQEQTRLLKRRDETGLRLVPILLKPCAWPDWLAVTEMRPRGDLALSEIREKEPSKVDRKLKEVIEEIAKILQPDVVFSEAGVAPGQDPEGGGMDEPGSVRLLADTLLAEAPAASRAALAQKLVGEIHRHTALSGEGLFSAVRFFIEFQMVRTDEPTSPAGLEESLVLLGKSDRARALINRLRQSGRAGDFSTIPIEVNSRFFSRARDHASLWKKYFDAVVRAGAATESTVTSLASIRVMMGFLSPQFLVAGLLSRFNDDWRPVLNAYQQSIPSPRQRRGAFESLQASQWNCWLMWGPSIPVCQCEQWEGLFALQYGYGDENNSIPVLELVADNGTPRTLGPIISALRTEGRSARFTVLTGRVRWGPFFLRPHEAPRERLIIDPMIDESEDPRETYGVAAAQASLYVNRALAHRQDSASLVLQLERVDESLPETRVYFSAYLWLMFLVAVPPENEEVAKIGPSLLRGKRYPPWPDDPSDRKDLRRAQLWGDLLPVFVHANIGDPDALRFQKQVLVENAVHLLRQVWDRRAQLFDRRDVEAGIQFHLVCGSDYSGCGCAVRFPAEESLVRQLQERMAQETDRAFAERVVLPSSDGKVAERPWGLAGYFSACHLPELIADYYEHVSQLYTSQPRS